MLGKGAYVRHHGDARIPRSYTTRDGDRLGAWVVGQRNRFARGMGDPDRSARFEELPGWTWGSRAGQSKAKTTPAGVGGTQGTTGYVASTMPQARLS